MVCVFQQLYVKRSSFFDAEIQSGRVTTEGRAGEGIDSVGGVNLTEKVNS